MKGKIIVGVVVAALLLALVPNKSLSSSNANASSKSSVSISSDNLIVLNSEVDGESTAAVISKAKELDAKLSGYGIKEKMNGKKPLYVFLNTPGGSIQAGLEMIEALKGLGRPVHTITLFAASMGFQIAQNLDDRLILKNGVLMSHHAKGEFQGEFGGESSQVQSRLGLWTQRMNELDSRTVERSNGKQTLASYQHAYTPELWVTGSQSVDQGYADRVVSVKCDSSLSGTSEHSADIAIFHVVYELDNCPLNTSPMNVKLGFMTNKGTYMNEQEFIKAGGAFGADCLVQSATDKVKICALDTSLNMSKIHELKQTFLNQYEQRMRSVVDLF